MTAYPTDTGITNEGDEMETDYGELNYAGFVRECGGVSPVTGEPLLAWAALCEGAREAWRHGAHYVAAEAERALREALRRIAAAVPLGRPASPRECEYILATARGALTGDAKPTENVPHDGHYV